jgi:hypothetical protein
MRIRDSGYPGSYPAGTRVVKIPEFESTILITLIISGTAVTITYTNDVSASRDMFKNILFEQLCRASLWCKAYIGDCSVNIVNALSSIIYCR